MKNSLNSLLLSLIVLLANSALASTNTQISKQQIEKNNEDSLRIIELDALWAELSRTVKEGDFEGYKVNYHDDAVVIFTSGKNKSSMPISKALAGWEKGFMDTKSGKTNDNVEFRFSQRIGDATTAHETGIFIYTSTDSMGEVLGTYIVHFEALLVKRNGDWQVTMEYQKSNGSQEDWDALK
ncbi:MAG: ketosteroid isomerase-like protein [Crocinitomicaceae bacterium]|jgi:hypothetical protein